MKEQATCLRVRRKEGGSGGEVNIFPVYDQLLGILPILGGVCGLLFTYRVLPRKPKNAERVEHLHRQFDKLSRVLSPVLIIFGLWRLMGGMTN